MNSQICELDINIRDEVIDEIETHVQSVLGGRVRDFCLLVREGGLVLHGYARAYYAKQLAQHAVMEATDLPILANEIVVA